MSTLQSLAEWPRAQRARVKGVFAEFDDTLTDDGRMEAPVLDAVVMRNRVIT